MAGSQPGRQRFESAMRYTEASSSGPRSQAFNLVDASSNLAASTSWYTSPGARGCSSSQGHRPAERRRWPSVVLQRVCALARTIAVMLLAGPLTDRLSIRSLASPFCRNAYVLAASHARNHCVLAARLSQAHKASSTAVRAARSSRPRPTRCRSGCPSLRTRMRHEPRGCGRR